MSFRETLQNDLNNVFFNTGADAEFAEVGQYKPVGGGTRTVSLIADATYNEAQPQVGTHAVRVQSSYRRVLVPVKDLSGVTVKKGDQITYNGETYNVVTRELDEAGDLYQFTLHRKPNDAPA